MIRSLCRSSRFGRSGLSTRRKLPNEEDLIALSTSDNSCPSVMPARCWTQLLGRYGKPSHARSIGELAITGLPLIGLWGAAWFAFSLGHPWASLFIAVPAAGFLVRLF